MAFLRRVDVEEVEAPAEIASTPFTVGRHAKCDLPVESTAISRRHFRIVREADRYLLHDLGSSNGTRVSGKKVEEAVPLIDGDLIEAGHVRLIFSSTGEGATEGGSPSRFCLRLLGSDVDFEVALDGDRATIGTAEDDTFRLTEHPDVGPGQVELLREGGAWVARDRGGPTPLAVCGVRRSEHHLGHGDDLTVGLYQIGFFNRNLPAERFRLTFLGGERGGEEVDLDDRGLTIGRGRPCTLVLPERSVSNRHARIEYEDGAFYIVDLGSANGTQVAGQKIEGRRRLEHGDPIEIGEETLVYRSSLRERPETLRRGGYRLLPQAGSGEPLVLAGLPVILGRDPKSDLVLPSNKASGQHARISQAEGSFRLKDLGSSNGTYLGEKRLEEGEEVPLSHGDIVRFADCRYVLKNDLRPLARRRSRRSVPSALGPVAGLVAAAALALVLVLPFGGEGEIEPVDPVGSGREIGGGTEASEPKSTVDEVDAALEVAQQALARYRPDDALMALEFLRPGPALDQRAEAVESLLRLARATSRPLGAFRRVLADCEAFETGLEVVWGGAPVEVVGGSDLGVRLKTGMDADERRWEVPWEEVEPDDLLAAFRAAGIDESDPLGTAALALSRGLEEEGKRVLGGYLSGFPDRAKIVHETYERFSGRSVPEGGWVVVGDRLGTLDELEVYRADLARRRAEEVEARARRLERLSRELEQAQAAEAARQEARDEFEPYLETIEAYFWTFEYATALEALEEYAARLRTLGLDDLVDRVEFRLAEGRGEEALFLRLIDSINRGTLLKQPEWKTASQTFEAQLTDATVRGVRIDLPRAEIYLRWRTLSPERLRAFWSCLSLDLRDRYFLGRLLLVRGLESFARQEWIRVVRGGDPDLKNRIDRQLAAHLGIAVPPGGFLLYEDRLVTPEEKNNLSQGLVRFQGRWMTRDERDKIQSGLIKYRDQWVTEEELAALKELEKDESYRASHEGFYREEGKWVYRFQKVVDGRLYLSVGGKYYPEEEARRLRGEWDNAWTLSTEHYDLRTNMSLEFLLEWADFQEEAWKAYAEYFGGEFTDRLELFAFRTHDDYRRYCEETGNQAQLAAGGFASSANDRGVGWFPGRKEALLSTMIHEGAHLYSFNVHPPHPMPSWYAEGIATQFEGYHWDAEKRELTLDYISRRRRPTVRNLVRTGSVMKLADLIRGHAGQAINAGPAQATQFYASAWALMNFLDRTDDPEVRPLADEYKRKMDGGEFGGFNRRAPPGPGQAPLEQVFGADLDWLQKKWEAYILASD